MIDVDLLLRIAGPLGTLILGKYLERWMAKRPRLVSYVGHVSAFILTGDTNPTTVHTHAIVVLNTGRLKATNVRIGHYVIPRNYTLFPSVAHRLEERSDGTADIVIDVLVPGEQVTISYLYFPPQLFNQFHSYTKSDEGFAKILTVLPTPQYPRWILRTLKFLVYIGVIALGYAFVELILWAIPIVRALGK
jgi:hypothetical protein